MSKRLVGRAALMAAVVGAARAREVAAGITYDLRFADGSHVKEAVPGTHAVELWARVSGTNGNNLDEGVQGGLHVIMSTNTGGGSLFGGITSAVLTPEFQSFSGTTPLHSNGSGGDLNGDGIIDWGSTSTSNANTNYLFVRAPARLTGPTYGQEIDANTWEFKLADLTVFVEERRAPFEGTTSFNVIKPSAAPTGPTAITYISARVDNISFSVTSANQQGAYTGSLGITFNGYVPEPTSLGLVGAASVLGLRRKRHGWRALGR